MEDTTVPEGVLEDQGERLPPLDHRGEPGEGRARRLAAGLRVRVSREEVEDVPEAVEHALRVRDERVAPGPGLHAGAELRDPHRAGTRPDDPRVKVSRGADPEGVSARVPLPREADGRAAASAPSGPARR